MGGREPGRLSPGTISGMHGGEVDHFDQMFHFDSAFLLIFESGAGVVNKFPQDHQL